MKKAITRTLLVALILGAGGMVWLNIHIDNQNAARAAQERLQSKSVQPEPSKYDVGPPDPQELLELVNEERRRVGVPPLEYDANVAKSAQLKADDMAAKGYRQHEIPGTGHTLTHEMASFSYGAAGCARVGENLAWNSADTGMTSQRIFNTWINSKPHREAIQSADYHRTGFGTANSLAVQHFCKNS